MAKDSKVTKIRIVYSPNFYFNEKTGKVSYKSQKDNPDFKVVHATTHNATVKQLAKEHPKKTILVYSTDGVSLTKAFIAL